MLKSTNAYKCLKVCNITV